MASEQPLRFAAFDGLRGLGMSLVLADHVLFHMPKLGGHGAATRAMSPTLSLMDMFFVLSGFLITGILYDAKLRAHYFRNYFVRRCLRIFPLYYLAMVALFWLAPAVSRLSEQPHYATLEANQAWYWLYGVNILMAFRTWDATPLFTSHLWSLAVEEQFYLLWPFAIFALGRRGILRLCAGAIVGAFLLRLGLHLSAIGDVDAVYVLAPARMDALAVGAALAILSRDPGGLQALSKRCVTPLKVAALTMLAITLFEGRWERTDAVTYLLGFSASTVFYGCALVWLAAHPGHRVTRFFSLPMFSHLGKHSYATYVLHYPLLGVMLAVLPADAVVAAMGPLGAATVLPVYALYTLLLALSSHALSLLLWHGYEKHFLQLKRLFPAPPAFRREPEQPAPAAARVAPEASGTFALAEGAPGTPLEPTQPPGTPPPRRTVA